MKNELVLKFDTHGNDKQKEVCRLWADNVTKDIVYGGSKGCLSGSCEIRTSKGLILIKDIKAGDLVLSFNNKLNREEWKPVIEVKKYRNEDSTRLHKLITFVMKDNQVLNLTPNHEIYIKGNWMPAGELARRTLDIFAWKQGKIRDIDGGSNNILEKIWTSEALFFRWFEDGKRLPDGSRLTGAWRSKFFSSQTRCFSFYPKPRKQTIGASQRFQSIEQSRIESNVGNRSRKSTFFKRQMPLDIQRQIRASRKCEINSRSSDRNKGEIQAIQIHSKGSKQRIWGLRGDNKGYNSAKELDPYLIKEIHFSVAKGYVYDLVVADNHNYCVTKDNIIVHNSGKSYLGVSLIFGNAFMYPGTHYFIARKTAADLRKHTSTSVAEVFKHWGITPDMWSYNGQDNYYKLYNSSRVYFLDAKYMPSDPTYARFGSIQMTQGMLEESGEFDPEAKNALAATIGRWKNSEYKITGKLLQTCNPSKNYLYQDYYLPHIKGELPERTKFVQALPQDNKMLEDGYLQHLEETLSENEKKRLLRGDWNYDTDPSALVDYDAMMATFKNINVAEGERYVSADIARMGGDRIVIISWNGYRGHVRSYKKELLTVTTKNIEAARVRNGCPTSHVIVDSDGMGSGVGDFGGFKHFRNNSRALSDPKAKRDAKGKIVIENFDNLKSQCGFRMAELINAGLVYLTFEDPSDEKLVIQELEQVKQKLLDSDMKKGLIPKEDVKKILRRSPDFTDAILMRVFFDLRPMGIKARYKSGNELRKPIGTGWNYE